MSNKVICEFAETCTQRLVMCEHQKLHDVKQYSRSEFMLRLCTDNGYCSVAEIECKCIYKR